MILIISLLTGFGWAGQTGNSFTIAEYFTSNALIAQNLINEIPTIKAVAVLDFGGDKTSTSGTFTIQFPTADASDAILRLA